MARVVVDAAEEILDTEFPVLNAGFVRLVDYLGGDERIVQAARVSYGPGTTSYRKDRALIDYLLRNDHSSPFEQVNMTFHLKMPIFVARQWIRHRTARVNEISGRYSVLKDEFYVPDGEAVALQSDDNKQGRQPTPVSKDNQAEIRRALAEEQKRAYGSYRSIVDSGIARELARINLPLSVYTELYWNIDLRNLFHFLNLRTDPHAQLEIRAYADVLLNIARRVCPMACDAFEEHVRGGVRFSRSEVEALRALVEGREPSLSGRNLERLNRKLRNGHE